MAPCRPNPQGDKGLRPDTALEPLTVATATLSELRLPSDTQDLGVMTA